VDRLVKKGSEKLRVAFVKKGVEGGKRIGERSWRNWGKSVGTFVVRGNRVGFRGGRVGLEFYRQKSTRIKDDGRGK